MRRDRSAGDIRCAMKGYMGKMVTRFDNWASTAKSPGIYQPPSYGIKQQFTALEDHSKPPSPVDVNTLQQLFGSVYIRHVLSILHTCTKPTKSAPNKYLQPKAYCHKYNAYSNTHALTLTPNSSFVNLKWS